MKNIINQSELESKIIDIFYTRHLCYDLGICYCNITKGDYEIAKRYVLENYQVKVEEKND